MYGAVGNTPHRKIDPFDPALSQFPPAVLRCYNNPCYSGTSISTQNLRSSSPSWNITQTTEVYTTGKRERHSRDYLHAITLIPEI